MQPIDFHAHFYPETIAPKVVGFLSDHYGIRVNYRGVRDEYVALARQAGLAASVFCTVATRPDQVRAANEWAIRNQSSDLIAFGTLHPDAEGIDHELARLKAAGIKGIKFHPDFQAFALDEDRALALYERLAPDFLLLLHVGDDIAPGKVNFATPQRLARVLDLLPGLKVIAAHMGGYQMWEQSKQNLVGRDVFFDTSSTLDILPDREFVGMVRDHGAHRVVMGSDYPFRDPEWEIGRLRRLGLRQDEFEAIVGNNAGRILGGL